jgi:hypothetical protein
VVDSTSLFQHSKSSTSDKFSEITGNLRFCRTIKAYEIKKNDVTAGDSKSPIMLEEKQLKQAEMSVLEQAFNEDSAYLKTMT